MNINNIRQIFTYLLLYISLISIVFIITYSNSNAQARIYNTKYPDKDTIFMGMCLIGDTLQTEFTIQNNTNYTIYSNDYIWPWYIMGNVPEHPQTFREFNYISPNIPYSIAPSDSKIALIEFRALDTTIYPAGWKYAKLILGLTASANKEDSNTAVKDTSILIAKKTVNYIDSYYDTLKIDSVYINSSKDISWTLQNSSSFSLSTQNYTFTQLNPYTGTSEFIVSDFQNISFPKKWDTINWNIHYAPRNLGSDTASLKTSYKPAPALKPDSLAYPYVYLIGTGVEQKLIIDSINSIHCNIIGDTIDFGDVRVDDSIEATVIIKNVGNIPFRWLSQNIYDNESSTISNNFSISKEFKPDYTCLNINKYDTIKIKFLPTIRDNYFARYTIQSDISNRAIYGYPKSALSVNFYLKGRGVEPVISIASNTIDFGTFITGCPELDTLFYISNLGNSDLIIKSISIEPSAPATPFSVSPLNLVIPTDSNTVITSSISLTFTTSNTDTKYVNTLKLITNARPPMDTVLITLKADVGRQITAYLKIPDNIRAKPGREISVPIIIDSGRVEFARTFSDTILFNHSLLKYEGYNTVGTASEIIPYEYINVGLVDLSKELVYISLKTPGESHFLKRDTLIELVFRTYLGNSISSQIAFQSPDFTDGECDKIFNLNSINGLFTLDSICGISLKTIPVTESQFEFNQIYPNPTKNSVNIKFQTSFLTNVKFNIFNAYGEKIKNIFDTSIPTGNFEFNYDCDNLIPGVYYIEMEAGIFKQVRILTVTR